MAQDFVLLFRGDAIGRRHGAQVQPLQEGEVDVSVEVEEKTHSPTPKETPQDEAALEVIDVWLAQDCWTQKCLASGFFHADRPPTPVALRRVSWMKQSEAWKVQV